MASHLGDDVAAYVDGQLSLEASSRADEHLDQCERCRQAVIQQRALKQRMGCTAGPLLPPGLLASLGAVPVSPARSSGSLPTVAAAVAVLVGAAMLVTGAAYALAPTAKEGDPVQPPFDRFVAMATAPGGPQEHLSSSAMDELDASGWPSQQSLGAGFQRVDGHLHDNREVVAQAYVGHGESFLLFEQVGSLAEEAVASFERRLIHDRPVWVRDGRPRVFTWDAGGLVYTVVTELADRYLGPLLADLPAGPRPPTPVERVRDGLLRMSSWP